MTVFKPLFSQEKHAEIFVTGCMITVISLLSKYQAQMCAEGCKGGHP